MNLVSASLKEKLNGHLCRPPPSTPKKPSRHCVPLKGGEHGEVCGSDTYVLKVGLAYTAFSVFCVLILISSSLIFHSKLAQFKSLIPSCLSFSIRPIWHYRLRLAALRFSLLLSCLSLSYLVPQHTTTDPHSQESKTWNVRLV